MGLTLALLYGKHCCSTLQARFIFEVCCICMWIKQVCRAWFGSFNVAIQAEKKKKKKIASSAYFFFLPLQVLSPFDLAVTVAVHRR